jgi:DNA-binding FadR family transcriptional regulator
LLLESTGNPYVRSLSSSIAAGVAWTTMYKNRSKSLARDPLPDYIDVFEAIASRNVDQSREAMSQLVQLALSDTRNVLGPKKNLPFSRSKTLGVAARMDPVELR